MPGPFTTAPPVRQLRRLREIATVLVKYGFPDIVARLHLEPTFALGRRLRALGRAPREVPRATRVERLRLALETLGPTFIKFGQALSIRADLFPADVIAELSRLQDDVPPLPFDVIRTSIETELGRPIEAVFARFDPVALAAASIAQVHRATLAGGEEVAVKVRRPGISATIEGDLAIMAQLARLVERYMPDAELYGPSRLVAEFARTVRREQDLAREGRTIERFARNFADDPAVHFPRVYWEQTRPGVLTLEYLDGVKLSEILRSGEGFDRPLIARRGAEVILKQILRFGLFHADPHPANVLVLPGTVIGLLDFGSVGRLDRAVRETFASFVLAVLRGDAERMADAVLSVERPPGELNVSELKQDLAEMLESYSGMRLGELVVGELLRESLEVMSRHRLRFPADLLLLARAFMIVEAVGRQLDPNFQLVEQARPMVEEILQQRYAPSAVVERVGELGREVAGALQSLPRDLVEIVAKMRGDRLQIQFVHRNLEHFIHEMDRSSNRLSFAVVIAALIVGSSLIFQSAAGPKMFGFPALGLIGFVTAALLGFWLAIGILRSGRL